MTSKSVVSWLLLIPFVAAGLVLLLLDQRGTIEGDVATAGLFVVGAAATGVGFVHARRSRSGPR